MLLIGKLIVLLALIASVSAGIVGWAVYGRLWLGIGALLAALMLGALAWYLHNWAEMDGLERLRWGVLIAVVALALVSLSWSLSPDGDLKGAALNFGTEMLGAVVTYALFELIIQRRESRKAERRATEARKARLIAQMRSDVRDVATAATEELRRHGWLTDGSSAGADLRKVTLEGANLSQAHLEGTNLEGASLEGSNLSNANLQDANLEGANLQNANLEDANLQNAGLQWANLQRANLKRVNLQGAVTWQSNFRQTKLMNADMKGAKLLFSTLEEANLSNADLREVWLTRVNLQGARLMYARLDGVNLSDANMQGTYLQMASLSHTSLRDASIEPSRLAPARTLAGATLPNGTKLSEDNWKAEFEEWRAQRKEPAHE
jgi:uncharacterized protein YjbI with pentapeptide repeats